MNDRQLRVQCSLDDKIGIFKQRLALLFNCQAQRIKLLYSTRSLSDNDKTLRDYNVLDGSKQLIHHHLSIMMGFMDIAYINLIVRRTDPPPVPAQNRQPEQPRSDLSGTRTIPIRIRAHTVFVSRDSYY